MSALPEQPPTGGEPRLLFTFEARRGGRRVALLRGVQAQGTSVVVETEVLSVRQDVPQAQRRPFSFPSYEQAMRFVEEALTALEYLNCEITR